MIKQFFKKVLISYLIIICCIFTPTYRAYAASPAGWAFNSFDMATSAVTAIRGGTSASVAIAKSPISQKIGKGILGGVIVGAAIPLAISQISGIALEAVDWVLDPANNAVKYRKKPLTGDVYRCNFNQMSDAADMLTAATFAADAVCKSYNTSLSTIEKTGNRFSYNCASGAGGDFFCNTVTAAPADDNWKTIPIPTVADKIYDNAKTDSASASIVNDAVKDYVNGGAADVALDAAKADADATHGCGTGTTWNGSACVATPDTPTDTPFDPSSIIDAINSVFSAIGDLFDAVMTLPDVINNALDSLLNDIKDFFQPVIDSVTDFFEWVETSWDEFVKPGDNEPTQLDIPNNVPTPTDTNIRFGGMCPPNADISLRIPFASLNFTLFDWSKWCYNLETFVKPVIILLAAYFSVLIFRGKNESS